MNKNRIFFIIFGIVLLVIAVYVWVQPNWALPTRSDDKMIHFIGLSKFLFGLAPCLGGLAMLRNSTKPEVKSEPLTVTLLFAGIFSLIISILLSKTF